MYSKQSYDINETESSENQEIPFLCLGRGSNPYGHFWPRDFKSRVSANSTTKANRNAKIVIFCEYEIGIPNQVWNDGGGLPEPCGAPAEDYGVEPWEAGRGTDGFVVGEHLDLEVAVEEETGCEAGGDVCMAVFIKPCPSQ